MMPPAAGCSRSSDWTVCHHGVQSAEAQRFVGGGAACSRAEPAGHSSAWCSIVPPGKRLLPSVELHKTRANKLLPQAERPPDVFGKQSSSSTGAESNSKPAGSPISKPCRVQSHFNCRTDLGQVNLQVKQPLGRLEQLPSRLQ